MNKGRILLVVALFIFVQLLNNVIISAEDDLEENTEVILEETEEVEESEDIEEVEVKEEEEAAEEVEAEMVEDDTEETVRTRLDVYHEQTEPLVDFYKNLANKGGPVYCSVKGVGSVEEIRDKVYAALDA